MMVEEIAEILSKKEKKKKKAKEPKIKLSKKEREILELASKTVLPEHYHTVWTEDELNELCEWLSQNELVAVDTETMGVNVFKDEIVGISFYAPHKGFYIPLRHSDSRVKCLPKELVISKLKPIMEGNRIKWIGHNIKFDIHVLRNWLGIRLDPYYDTMIAQWLLDENQSKALKDLAPLYLKIEADKYSTLFGKVTFDKVPILLNEDRTGNLATYYAVKDTELTYKLYEFQMKHLLRPELKNLYDLMFNVEMPFLKIVTEAEAVGVKFDADYIEKEIAPKLEAELEELKQKITAILGDINLNSPAQLADALYNKLKLPRVNQDKPDSTDKDTLKKLKKEHEVASLLLQYREKEKLIDAFVKKLPKEAINGRIHTSFQTIGAATGRMSSSNPNLQQIPPIIRHAFIADEGRFLAAIDFSQQELRILAHVSQDPVLLQIYKEGKDVHSMTAVSIWNKKYPNDTVTYEEFEYCRNMCNYFLDEDGNIVEDKFNDEAYIKELYNSGSINTLDKNILRRDTGRGIAFEKMRKNAKSVNFGIIYGMSEKGLSKRLEISEEEAKMYIQSYFNAYPGVKKWIDEVTKTVLKQKYTTTLLGRKRRVYPEINSGERWLIERGIRQARNAIIQGSGADMVKLASIKLQPLLKELDARILLWVHDEIIFDVPENIGMENLRRIADVMCNALPLDTGMKSDIEVGKRWGQKLKESDLEMQEEEDIN